MSLANVQAQLGNLLSAMPLKLQKVSSSFLNSVDPPFEGALASDSNGQFYIADKSDLDELVWKPLKDNEARTAASESSDSEAVFQYDLPSGFESSTIAYGRTLTGENFSAFIQHEPPDANGVMYVWAARNVTASHFDVHVSAPIAEPGGKLHIFIKGYGGSASGGSSGAQQGQTISFSLPATTNIGDGNLALGATASSGLGVTYTITQGDDIASVVNGELVFTGGGDVTVAADQAGDATYNAAPQVTQTVTVEKQDQTIDFTLASTFNMSSGNLALGATASSGLAVAYAITQGDNIASITNGELVFTGGGDVTVTADQAGGAAYNAAPQVTQTVTVTDDVTDTDGDGTPDIGDAFPNDPSEDTDSDSDGVGDNADAFPNDPSEDTDSDSDGVGDNADAFPDDPRYTEHSFIVSIFDTSENIFSRTGDDIGTIAFGTDTLSLYIVGDDGFSEWLSGGLVVSIMDTEANILSRTGDDIGTIAFGTDTFSLYIVGNDGFSEWLGGGFVVGVIDTEANILSRTGDAVGTIAFATDTNSLYVVGQDGFSQWASS